MRALTRTIVFCVACLALVLLIVGSGMVYRGCEEINQATEADNARFRAEDDAALVACTKAGGFIVRSGWTNKIVDCKVVR